MRKHILNWFEKADEDIIAAQIIIEHRPILLNIPCFHCQQAIEKYLKAFLIFNGKELIKTHNLNFLLEGCISLDEDFTNFNLKELNSFGITGRYPADMEGPELSDVLHYLKIAEQVKQLVIGKIKL